MNYLSFIENKIVREKETLIHTLSQWRFKEEKIVFTNTDASVKRLKGDKRPVNNQEARALLLASLLFTDKIIFFDEDTPLELIRFIQPDILVKGSDYKPEEIVGYDIVKAKGGEIITIDLTPGFSTTSILQKL